MIRWLVRAIIGGRRVQYTPEKISEALDILAHNIAKIGLSAQIISPMFDGEIDGKKFDNNRETIPLVIILEDAIRFIYGRLGRCYFDGQGRDNNTASIRVLIDQIFNNYDAKEDRKVTHRKQFDAINRKLDKAKNYKKKLNAFCNKHYAHADIKALKDVEAEEIKISIPWNELVDLITHAKEIVKDMFVVCQKPPFNYSEHVYQEYANQFWKLINFT